jgi:Protein of unknown function (DUF998)
VKVLRVLAVFGPVLFTLDWVLLGLAHPGYRTREETISALSAHNASGWPLMTIGQVALGVAFVAVATLFVLTLGRRGLVTAVLMGLAAEGTAQLTVFRTICTHADKGWCTPLGQSAYPHQQWAHGVGAGIAFTSLPLACLACAWATWRVIGLRDVAVVALVCEAIALPNLVWFLGNVGTTWHGFSEKLFLTSLATFVGYTGIRLGGLRPPRTPGKTRQSPG